MAGTETNAMFNTYNEACTNTNDYMPVSTYVGDHKDGVWEGIGTLYQKTEIGMTKLYQGTFVFGKFMQGKCFNSDGTVSMDGLFTYDIDGKLMIVEGKKFNQKTLYWCGKFKAGIPDGFGRGSFHGDYTFVGSYINGTKHDGKLLQPDGVVRYEGSFIDNLFHGYGTLFDENGYIHFIGKFVRHENVSGILYNETSIYAGSFLKKEYQGTGALFYKLGASKLLKFVGQFEKGKMTKIMKVYETNTDDPILQSKVGDFDDYTSGKFIGTCEYKLGKVVEIEVSWGNVKSYKGEGIFSLNDETYLVPHGWGTVYVHKKKRYTAFFESGLVETVSNVYDEKEMLMFSTTLESDVAPNFLDDEYTWPAVSGYGTVYDKNENPMYRANFRDGKMVGFSKFLSNFPLTKIKKINEKVFDPITLEELETGYGYTINDSASVYSAPTMVNLFQDKLMKDPLRGAYPALRIEIVYIDCSKMKAKEVSKAEESSTEDSTSS